MDATTITPDQPATLTVNTGIDTMVSPLKNITIDIDAEPHDSNSMEPSPSLYVAPPAPSHCNNSRRQSSGQSFDATAMGLMADVSLESPITKKALSPIEEPVASPTTREAALSVAMFTTKRAVEMPSNSTKSIQFVLDSPHAIEMHKFSNEPSSPVKTTPKVTEVHQPVNPSFFSGFLAIPPSLSRPRLSPQYAEYVKREFARGPASLLWEKTPDIENQGSITA